MNIEERNRPENKDKRKREVGNTEKPKRNMKRKPGREKREEDHKQKEEKGIDKENTE